MEYWELSDEVLLEQCDWYTYRARGAGGQKRNKTSSAIRIIHRPTGVTVVANESRLQGENRTLAMSRLRHTLALSIRREIDPETFTVPEEITAQLGKGGRLGVNPENPRYLPIIACVLDLLNFYRGQVSPTADRLGLSTTNVINLLHRDPKLWTVAQAMRQRYHLPPLKP